MEFYTYKYTEKQLAFFSGNLSEKLYCFSLLNDAESHALSNAPQKTKAVIFYKAQMHQDQFSIMDDAKSRYLSINTFPKHCWLIDQKDINCNEKVKTIFLSLKNKKDQESNKGENCCVII